MPWLSAKYGSHSRYFPWGVAPQCRREASMQASKVLGLLKCPVLFHITNIHHICKHNTSGLWLLERQLVCLNRRRTLKIFGQNFVSNCHRRITFWQIQHQTHFLLFASFKLIHISIMCSFLHHPFHVNLSDGTLLSILILYAFSPFFPLN